VQLGLLMARGWPSDGLARSSIEGRLSQAASRKGLLVIGASSLRAAQTLLPQAWRQLSASMTGPVLLDGDEQFETLRRPATNRYQTPHPQAITRCATSTDVAHVINFARRYGLETAVRGAGHSFADHSSTAPTQSHHPSWLRTDRRYRRSRSRRRIGSAWQDVRRDLRSPDPRRRSSSPTAP